MGVGSLCGVVAVVVAAGSASDALAAGIGSLAGAAGADALMWAGSDTGPASKSGPWVAMVEPLLAGRRSKGECPPSNDAVMMGSIDGG